MLSRKGKASCVFTPQQTLRETNNFTQRVQSGKESRG